MSLTARNLNKPRDPSHRFMAGIASGVLACLMGSWAWLMAIVFFVSGALVVHSAGLDVPSWVGWVSLIGMPVGAWLETRFAD